MGHAPDWMRGSMKKTGAAPAKPGIVSRPIFHAEKAAVQRFADGGMVDYDNPGKIVGEYAKAPDSGMTNMRGEKVGVYQGNDEIVKRRMGMIDEKGNSLLKKDNLVDESVRDAGLVKPAAESPKPVAPVKPAPAKTTKVSVRKPASSQETIGPQALKMNRTAESELLHDESAGGYDSAPAAPAVPSAPVGISAAMKAAAEVEGAKDTSEKFYEAGVKLRASRPLKERLEQDAKNAKQSAYDSYYKSRMSSVPRK